MWLIFLLVGLPAGVPEWELIHIAQGAEGSGIEEEETGKSLGSFAFGERGNNFIEDH